MTPAKAHRLRQHGLAVTPGTLQGLPVLLLALVPASGRAVQASAPVPAAPAASGATPRPARANLPAPAGAGQRHFCHIQRPPHRPLRS